MPNIPNFIDVNRAKIDFFSPKNIIKSKGNFLSQGQTTPLPSQTPSQTPSPSITPTITPTVTPTATPFGYFIVGSGVSEQVSVTISPGFENSIIFFNGSGESFEFNTMSISYNGTPSSLITYSINKENTSFTYYPGTGNKKFIGTFTNNGLIDFTS